MVVDMSSRINTTEERMTSMIDYLKTQVEEKKKLKKEQERRKFMKNFSQQ